MPFVVLYHLYTHTKTKATVSDFTHSVDKTVLYYYNEAENNSKSLLSKKTILS